MENAICFVYISAETDSRNKIACISEHGINVRILKNKEGTIRGIGNNLAVLFPVRKRKALIRFGCSKQIGFTRIDLPFFLQVIAAFRSVVDGNGELLDRLKARMNGNIIVSRRNRRMDLLFGMIPSQEYFTAVIQVRREFNRLC